MNNIRILLADDHQMCRSGIKSLLERVSGFAIVGEAGDGREAIALAQKTPADVFLMDISLPLINGLQASREILKEHPALKILLLSGQAEDEYVKAMADSGVKGYLLKRTSIEELITAIRTIHQGNSYFSKEVTEKLFAEIQHPHLAANGYEEIDTSITERELEILELITQEKINKEIASELKISPRTVDTHRRNLLQKLQVKNTAGLVMFYVHWRERQAQLA